MSFNVHGLANKVLFNDFFTFVKSYDIFVLSETFVTAEGMDRYGKYFGGYVLKWVGAERTAGRGRASGGMVIGYDSRGKGWNARWVDEDGVGVLRVADGRGALVGIVPLYLNCGDW